MVHEPPEVLWQHTACREENTANIYLVRVVNRIHFTEYHTQIAKKNMSFDEIKSSISQLECIFLLIL